ncbi:MAG: VWA domain-containing protein [Flavobacteriaceae bacterium]|nr:VWA domain-containing protein [Flavobacteriaceae bacterium]
MYNIETLQISSTHPCLIIYLLDHSNSMAESDGTAKKGLKLAHSINEIIFETGLKCVGANGDIRNRFELSVIGYGTSVSSAWQGALSGSWVVPISEVFNNPISMYNDIPLWISERYSGQTSMRRAFENAYRICEDWINWGNHRDCHPPIIINITDGMPTDGGFNFGDLAHTVRKLMGLRTNYGNVNVFNIHIDGGFGDTIAFPNYPPNNNQYAHLLFDLSSSLNPHMIQLARNAGYNIKEGAKGYIFNGSGKNLMDFLNIGSNPI